MKRTGRLLAVSAAAVCALGTMTSCNKTGFKVGLLCLHGQTSTYDKNFIEAFEDVCKEFKLKEGVGYEIRTDVKEDYNDIYTAAKEWAEDGYSMVFADSFGHQYGLIDVAKEYPKTEFCHATGTTSLLNYEPNHEKGKESLELHNYHNAFAHIYKGRYLAGVAAGAKMVEDIKNGKYKLADAKIGYVGAWPYAEVISGYTSFYLGACSQFDAEPTFNKFRPTMYVKYTYSWYDYGAEKEAAFSLIRNNGCKLISQHADSMGAPQACAAEGIPNVCYNISTKAKTPKTYLYGSKINWRPYFRNIISSTLNKYNKAPYAPISTDYVGDLGLSDDEKAQDGDMVNTLEFGDIATKDIRDKVKEARTKLYNGEIHVFDLDKFTISKQFFGKDDPRNHNPFATVKTADSGGKYVDIMTPLKNVKITAYMANVQDYDDNYAADTEVVKKDDTHNITYIDESGYIESATKVSTDSFRSAPFFELIIDGIETLN